MATESAMSTPLSPTGVPGPGPLPAEGGPTPSRRERWARDHALPINVVVVDAQAVFRTGLAGILGEDDRIAVLATSHGDASLGEFCAERAVDVVVTDLAFAHIDGIELIRRIAAASPNTKILVVAAVADWYVIPALTSGAAGFLLKDADPEAILSAVVAVYLGEQVLCREAIEMVFGNVPMRHLSRREAEILQLVAQGIGNKEIARRLDLGEKTVRNYVSRIYRKLSVRNRVEAAAFAAPSHLPRAAGIGAPEPARDGSDLGANALADA